jgi:hypothetical protein
MSGLAEYLPIPSCPYPDIVAQWEAIPAQQVAGFTPEGFSSHDCFQGLGDYLVDWNFTVPQRINGQGTGLGDIAMTAPGGYFASMDFTQWGVAEWGTVAGGVYFLMSLLGDAKRGVKRVSTRARKIKRGFAN